MYLSPSKNILILSEEEKNENLQDSFSMDKNIIIGEFEGFELLPFRVSTPIFVTNEIIVIDASIIINGFWENTLKGDEYEKEPDFILHDICKIKHIYGYHIFHSSEEYLNFNNKELSKEVQQISLKEIYEQTKPHFKDFKDFIFNYKESTFQHIESTDILRKIIQETLRELKMEKEAEMFSYVENYIWNENDI